MLNATEFGELLELIYTAAETPEVWGEFLDRSAIFIGARSCNLMLFDRDDLQLSLAVTAQIDPKLAVEMREWGARDIWIQNSMNTSGWNRPGLVIASQEVVADDVVLKSEYYNEYLIKIGISQTVACLLFSDPHTASTLNYYYSPAAGLRTPEQMELARRLTPHVQRALRLHQRLGGMATTQAALTGSLDSLGSGFVLMNERGRILFMNRAAETMLQRQDGLRQHDGRLAANSRHEDAALQASVSAAARTTTGTGFSSGGLVRVTRPSGKASYTVTIMPVSPHGQLLEKQKAKVVALLTDPESIPIPGAMLLRGLFDLTAAESAVAQFLMQGLDRQEIADRLSVSLNTVRTHLRNLFSKTATSSQAKLVRLLLVTTRTVPDLARMAL